MLFFILSIIFVGVYCSSDQSLEFNSRLELEMEQMNDDQLEDLLVSLRSRTIPPDKPHLQFLSSYFQLDVDNINNDNDQFAVQECFELSGIEIVECVVERIVLNVNTMKHKIFICLLFEIFYVLFWKKTEKYIFKIIAKPENIQTSEFIIYQVKNVNLRIYYIVKIFTLILKITTIVFIFTEVIILFVEIIFFTLYVIFFGIFTSVYGFMVNKGVKYKLKDKLRLKKKRKLNCAVPELGTTFNSDLYNQILNKLFSSNDVSEQFVSSLVNLVFGSLYEYGVKYLEWRKDNDNEIKFQSNDRNMEFKDWSWFRKRQINIDRERNILLQWKKYDNRRIIEATIKLIVICADYELGRKHSINKRKFNERNYFLKTIEQKHNKLSETLVYDYKNNCMLERKCYFIGTVIYDVIVIGKGFLQIHCYNEKVRRTDCLAKKITGKVVVRSDDHEILLKKIKKIDSSFDYQMDHTLVEHPFSHAISKIKHMKIINDNLNLKSNEKILDVGSSFCDIELGNGVVYNIAEIESQDQKRILDSLNRIDNYLSNRTQSITIYYGDVTQFDFSNTNITKILLHNCCYNIDMLNFFDMCNRSGIETVVNSVQTTLNVLHGRDSESVDNEMFWTFDVTCENESSISFSNATVTGKTNVDSYVHNYSIMMDWFKICSVTMKYNNINIIWNSILDQSKDGYYVFKWNVSSVKKISGEIGSNDEYFDLISISKDQTYLTIIPTVRNKRMSMVLNTFAVPSNHKNRESRENVITIMLNNRMTARTNYINIQTDKEWESLNDITEDDVVLYRQNQPTLKQQSIFVKCEYNIQEERSINHILKEEETEMFEIVESVEQNDITRFEKLLLQSNNMIVFEIGEEYYSLETNRSNKYNKKTIYICKEGGFIYKKFIYGKEIVFKNVNQLYNMIWLFKIECLNDQEVLSMIKKKEINNLCAMIRNRKISKFIKLEEKEMFETEDTTINNVKVKVMEQRYIVPQVIGASDVDVREAIKLGKIRSSFVNSILSIDLRNGNVIDPFNITRIRDKKIDIARRVNVDYYVYDNNITRNNRIRVLTEDLNTIVKIIDVEGNIIYTSDVFIVNKLSVKEGFIYAHSFVMEF